MASKHGRDQALDFQGFLNDLQDWELSLKDKDKKMKSQASDKEQLKSSEKGRPTGKRSLNNTSTTSSGQYDYLHSYDKLNNLSSSFVTEENMPDSASEKELGNEYFKQKKFKEAINCYSRSIALSPTAVAHANRAMAYLKIKKFQEAEDDCTEALNLDDRYIKAYSRRATARKELGKLKESIEDAEFSLRLEPNNQEIKKQHAEFKSLYEKEILQKASGVLRRSMHGAQEAGKSETKENGLGMSVSNSTQRTGVAAVQGHQTEVSQCDKHKKPEKDSITLEEIGERNIRAGSRTDGVQLDAEIVGSESVKRNNRDRKQELKASVQELASRAASRAMAEAAKNISPPNTAYHFEVSWRALSGDRALQAHLLKILFAGPTHHIQTQQEGHRTWPSTREPDARPFFRNARARSGPLHAFMLKVHFPHAEKQKRTTHTLSFGVSYGVSHSDVSLRHSAILFGLNQSDSAIIQTRPVVIRPPFQTRPLSFGHPFRLGHCHSAIFSDSAIIQTRPGVIRPLLRLGQGYSDSARVIRPRLFGFCQVIRSRLFGFGYGVGRPIRIRPSELFPLSRKSSPVHLP